MEQIRSTTLYVLTTVSLDQNRQEYHHSIRYEILYNVISKCLNPVQVNPYLCSTQVWIFIVRIFYYSVILQSQPRTITTLPSKKRNEDRARGVEAAGRKWRKANCAFVWLVCTLHLNKISSSKPSFISAQTYAALNVHLGRIWNHQVL
jgi:hypothetical protein